MTTSQPTSFLSEIVGGEPIPAGRLGYFRSRLSNLFHELVLSRFVELEREGKISRAELARRINKKPEQITRWLGAPGNWTLDTASDLLLGMGCEPALSITILMDEAATTAALSWNDFDAELEPAELASFIPEDNSYMKFCSNQWRRYFPITPAPYVEAQEIGQYYTLWTGNSTKTGNARNVIYSGAVSGGIENHPLIVGRVEDNVVDTQAALGISGTSNYETLIRLGNVVANGFFRSHNTDLCLIEGELS